MLSTGWLLLPIFAPSEPAQECLVLTVGVPLYIDGLPHTPVSR